MQREGEIGRARLEREPEKREDKTMLAANIYTIPATFSSTNAICRHGPCISVHTIVYMLVSSSWIGRALVVFLP